MSAPDLVPPGTTGGGAPVGGSGTIGTVPKWATSTTLGDSVITESGGNVGVNANLVGVSTPDRLIIGAPGGTAGTAPFGIIIGRSYAEGAGRARLGLGDDQRGIGLSGTDHTVVHAYSSNSILFGHGTPTSLAAKMTILPSGNVGIGTASPDFKLEVNGTIGLTDVGGPTYSSTISAASASPFRILTIASRGGAGSWRGAINLDTNYNAGSLFTALTIRANTDGTTANVGIGTTSPTAALHLPTSTTARASLNITSGTAPTSPNNGDIWFDGTDIKMQIGGVTKTFTLV